MPIPAPLAPLAALRQFIAVLLVPQPDGKTQKFPIDYRTGLVTKKGSGGAHDPEIWMSYDEAATTVARLGGAPSYCIGFVLRKGCGFFVVDIDDALTPTGWSQTALDVIAALPGCAVEISQSGRGLHVWGRSSNIPDHGKKNTALNIECYSDLRFVALGSGAVGEMAPECTKLPEVIERYFPPPTVAATDHDGDGPRPDWRGPTDDGELIRRMLRSQSKARKFGGDGKATPQELWDYKADVLARYYASRSGEPFDASSVDAAFAQHLAFWTGCDAARMKRIMLDSPLYRPKYDREDYLDRTIAFAIELQVEVLIDKPRPTADAVITVLRQLTQDQVRENWIPLALDLSASDTKRVLDYVEGIGVAGRQALKTDLGEARAEAAREARERSITERVRHRTLIRWRPEDSTQIAREIERLIVAAAKPGEYISFAGVLSQVTEAHLPGTIRIDDASGDEDAAPPVPQIATLNRTAVRERAERVASLHEVTKDGATNLIGIPDRVIDTLIDKDAHAAPQVTGLLTHPVALLDGSILNAQGLHEPTGLFLSGVAIPDARPYSQVEAQEALARLRATFLDGFDFASPLDADAALAALLTGVERRLLDVAPGFALIARMQSSGKTTLARRLHLVLTGHDMPVSIFPLGDEAEISKRLLASLMRSPVMICFDNVEDGETFASSALAPLITSSTLTQRLLQFSREVTVPTNVLFVVTGNNLSLGADEVSRFVVVRLISRTARPHERTFANPDVVAHAIRIRAQVLRDVVGIVAGYRVSGASIGVRSRFERWDRLVRQPLIWAGAADVAEVFRANTEDSEPMQAHRGLLWALSTIFPDQWISAAQIIAAATFPTEGAPTVALRAALQAMPVSDWTSAKSIGRALRGFELKPATVDGRDLRLESKVLSHTKVYRVAPC